MANLENALNIADQIRGLIEGQTAHPFKITASFGVTEVKESDDLKNVIDRADTALYEAKESGRNRVKTR
ncbi:MAG TPA: diguanylate cyclase [Sulfurimonas sp.]|uniref:diguanylate cyclase n=1 Tax=Sulfurimonas sp. TaxID=2022749 RepID=UPI002BF7CC04|nr:diguanylate cyclase [Sulfurimonas sp.]HUH42047.1 diguanylate cyclase [Sulfurimonas sp.]